MAEPARRAFAGGLAEFLTWEHDQAERYEFVDGAVRLMAGGTADHDTIGVNLIVALANALRGGPCRVHGSNLKLLARRREASMYPDLYVRCGPVDGRATWTDEALIVVEVLSRRTAAHDLSRKRLAFQAIPTLRRILYVEQEAARVHVVARDPAAGGWSDEAVSGLDATLGVPEIGLTLRLAEIYAGTEVARGAAVG